VVDLGWQWPWVLAAAVACVAAGVLIVIGVRYLERGRPRRRVENAVQAELVRGLRREHDAAGLTFVPEVAVTGDQPLTITVSGVVPSEAARRRVLEAVDRAARDLGLTPRIEDALSVEVPGQRAAG
jgi:hypothetical protein